MSLLTKSNVKEHCRTCLKQLNYCTECTASDCHAHDVSKSKNLYFNLTNDPELHQLVSINVDVFSTSNALNQAVRNYPENVCLACYNKLYTFAIFRRRAQQSAEKLHTVLSCSGNIKVETHFEEIEDKQPMYHSVQACEFQLHDATAENEETFFETSVANLDYVELNNDTVDPFSPSPPSISNGSDRDLVEVDADDKRAEEKVIEDKEVEKNKVKDKVIQKQKSRITKPPKVIKKEKYRCPQCNEGFAKNAELTDHVNQVHALGSTPFLCDYCDKSYRHLRSLKEHVLDSHQSEIKAQEHFQCPQCPVAFLDESELKKHKGLHLIGKKTRVCGICGESFAVKKWLIEHLRTHTSDGRVPCALCDKTYTTSDALENHERAVHLKEKPHYCQICDKSFQNKQSFRIHNYRHSGKKPYLCDICGNDFRQRTQMKTHRLTHFKNDMGN